MDREILLEKSLNDLRTIAKLQGVKAATKYRKSELIDIIMAGGVVESATASENDYSDAPVTNGRETAAETETATASNEKPVQAPVQESYVPSYQQNRTSYSPIQQTTRPQYEQRQSYNRQDSYQQRSYSRDDYSRNDSQRQGGYGRDNYRSSYRQQDNYGGYQRNDYRSGYSRNNDYSRSDYRQQDSYGYRNNYNSDYRQQDGGYNTDYRRQNYYQQPSQSQQYMVSEMQDPANIKDPETGLTPAIASMLASGECQEVEGVLEVMQDGYGFLRCDNYMPGPNDIYISVAQIKRFGLKNGDLVKGRSRPTKDSDRYLGLLYVDEVNGLKPEEVSLRVPFDELVPVFPDFRLTLEHPMESKSKGLAIRLIDLLAPIGKGQRGMIVSQPKAGKTTLLKQIANGITTNYPDIHLIVLLIDERPEEVTDMQRSISGEVVYSTFDELPEHHTRIAEMVMERSMRLVEHGKDVVVLLDSITRLARAYNLTIPNTGKTLSGGMDPGALHKPKRFFGAARNIENGGSLTVIATALTETGSRMDDMVFEEFKGTGNMEIHLDRKLSEKRIFPAIDIYKSGTRRDDLLLSEEEQETANTIRRMMSSGNTADVTEQVISMLDKTESNAEFVKSFSSKVTSVFEKEGYSLGRGFDTKRQS